MIVAPRSQSTARNSRLVAAAGRPAFGLLALALAFVILVAAGCGGDDGDGKSEEELIAETVNEFWSAVAANDADAACDRLSPRGQQLMIRLANQAPDAGDRAISACADAVSAYAESPAGEEDPGEFSADDVRIAGAGVADVQCVARGAISAERTDGDWLVSVPACVD